MSKEPNVLISWSGPLSRAVATKLRDWLPLVVNQAVPWISAEDISKGAGWNAELNGALARCKFSLVALTESNKNAPWILFEAGTIFRALETSRVFTLLCDLSHADITGPLTQFQATEFNKQDVLRLCRSIAAAVSEGEVDVRLERHFESYWPELEGCVQSALSAHPRPTSVSIPQLSQDAVNELLATTRAIHRNQSEVSNRVDVISTRMEALITQRLAALSEMDASVAHARSMYQRVEEEGRAFTAMVESLSEQELAAINRRVEDLKKAFVKRDKDGEWTGRFRVGSVVAYYRAILNRGNVHVHVYKLTRQEPPREVTAPNLES